MGAALQEDPGERAERSSRECLGAADLDQIAIDCAGQLRPLDEASRP
jgi:hypothetical protein